MFCGKCGNPMDDNAAFCPNCGALAENNASAAEPVQEVEYYVETEVLSPEENNVQYYAPQPVYPSMDLNTAGEVAKPKKKRSKKPLLIVVIAVVLIAAVLAVFNWNRITVLFDRTFSKPDAQNTKVYQNAISKTFDSVTGSGKEDKASSVDLSNMGVDAEIRLNIDDQILSMIPTQGMDISWLSDIAIGYDLSVKDDLAKVVLDMILGDTSIISAEAIADMDSMELYASVPELNDKAIYVNLMDLMEQSGAMAVLDPEMMAMLAEVIPSADTLESIANRYVGVVMSGFGQVEKSNEKVEVSGISQKLYVLTATMDEDDLLKLAENLIKTLKKDEDIKSIILSLEEYVGQEGLYDSFTESMDEALDALSESDSEDMPDIKLTLVTYLNDVNDIVGIKVKASSDGEKIEPFSWVHVEQGKKFASEIEISSGMESLVIEGSGETDKAKNAEYVITFADQDILIIELKDYISNEEQHSGTVRIMPSENVMEMLLSEASLNDSIADLIGSADPALEIKFNNNAQGSNGSVALAVGNKSLITISVSAKTKTPDAIEIPEDYIEMQDEDSIMEWVETMNPEFLDTLMDRLIEAGVPAELFAFN